MKLQLEKKREEREKEAEDQKRLDNLWNQKIQNLGRKQTNQRNDILDQNKKHQDFLKQQMEVL